MHQLFGSKMPDSVGPASLHSDIFSKRNCKTLEHVVLFALLLRQTLLIALCLL